METVNVHKAKTNFSKLLDAVSKGESFEIAKAGKPVAHLVPIAQPTIDTSKRFGWAKDENWTVPKDFDRWAEDEIREMFEGKE